MSLCHAVLRDLGGKCVCVSPCHWGKERLLVYARCVMVDRQGRGTEVGSYVCFWNLIEKLLQNQRLERAAF